MCAYSECFVNDSQIVILQEPGDNFSNCCFRLMQWSPGAQHFLVTLGVIGDTSNFVQCVVVSM